MNPARERPRPDPPDGRPSAELDVLGDGTGGLPARLQETIRAARSYAEAARAPNTLRAYASDIDDFTTYCRVEAGGLPSLPAPPEAVALYITDLVHGRGLKTSTVQRRLASISALHKRNGLPSPTEEVIVRETMKGIRHTHGSHQDGAAPLTVGALRRVLGAIREEDPGGDPKKTKALKAAAFRDRALLLLGFAASLRRSEISALLVSDLAFLEGEGVVVEVRRSKTDRHGEGEGVGIPYGDHEGTCPVTHLSRWIAFSGRAGDDPLFCRVDRHGNLKEGGLSGWGINELVQRRVENAGLDATRFSGHSMRAGLPTSASAQKVGMEAWMPHTRHKSVKVAMRYARRGTLFVNNPAAQVGL